MRYMLTKRFGLVVFLASLIIAAFLGNFPGGGGP